MSIAKDMTELVGKTPLVQLNRVTQGCKAKVVAKLVTDERLGMRDRCGCSLFRDLLKNSSI